MILIDALALGTFDILLCSDLIYGDIHLAETLSATLRALSHVSTVVIFVHEARFAGNQGQYFLDLMRSSHAIDEIAFDALDSTYRSSHIYVHILRSLECLKRSIKQCKSS
jgi:predicted nicotinamide N-methyase